MAKLYGHKQIMSNLKWYHDWPHQSGNIDSIIRCKLVVCYHANNFQDKNLRTCKGCITQETSSCHFPFAIYSTIYVVLSQQIGALRLGCLAREEDRRTSNQQAAPAPAPVPASSKQQAARAPVPTHSKGPAAGKLSLDHNGSHHPGKHFSLPCTLLSHH